MLKTNPGIKELKRSPLTFALEKVCLLSAFKNGIKAFVTINIFHLFRTFQAKRSIITFDGKKAKYACTNIFVSMVLDFQNLFYCFSS